MDRTCVGVNTNMSMWTQDSEGLAFVCGLCQCVCLPDSLVDHDWREWIFAVRVQLGEWLLKHTGRCL